MDYSQWQQLPAPAMQPAEANQSANNAYRASYPYYAQIPNPSLHPNPSSSLNAFDIAEPPPPGVDGYSSKTVQPLSAVSVAIAAPPSSVAVNTMPSYGTVNTTPSYVTVNTTPSYVAVNTAPYYTLTTNTQNWPWQEAAQFHVPGPLTNKERGATIQTNGTVQAQSICPVSSSTGYEFQAQAQAQAQLPGRVSSKKKKKSKKAEVTSKKKSKKAKVLQSVHCEVCKVDCNTPSVFELHKLGKKHLKNMEKSKAVSSPKTSVPLAESTVSSSKTSVPLAESTVTNPLTIGPEEKPCKCKTKKVRKKGSEDLEVKRQKIVECGATTEKVRLCTICNIVCNSETVYTSHLAGQKHAIMMKRLAAKAARKN